jgi:hypothetical protein
MHTISPFPRMLAALLICLLSGAPGLRAAEPKSTAKPAANRSLDDELLEGLGDPADDEDLGAKSDKIPAKGASAAKSKRSEAKPRARRAAADDLDDELLKGLGGGEDVDLGGKPGKSASGEAADNPLFDLGRRMREAEQRIAAARSDEETQQLQDRIADDLAKLIKELQRRKKSSSSSSSNKNQQTAEREKVEQPGSAEAGGQEEASDAPAQDSTALTKDRKARTPDAAQMDEALKDIWGQLPAHLRQQMEQYAKEELLPKYELQIEEYFRALAKGQRRP